MCGIGFVSFFLCLFLNFSQVSHITRICNKGQLLQKITTQLKDGFFCHLISIMLMHQGFNKRNSNFSPPGKNDTQAQVSYGKAQKWKYHQFCPECRESIPKRKKFCTCIFTNNLYFQYLTYMYMCRHGEKTGQILHPMPSFATSVKCVNSSLRY